MESRKSAGKSTRQRPTLSFNYTVLQREIIEPYKGHAFEKAATWVNRPFHARMAEALGRDGKINRPLNAFILFRLGYYVPIVEYLARQNIHNNSVVSQVAGQLWRMESSMRETYKSLAETERRNHHGAYPQYKFSRKPSSGKPSDPCSSGLSVSGENSKTLQEVLPGSDSDATCLVDMSASCAALSSFCTDDFSSISSEWIYSPRIIYNGGYVYDDPREGFNHPLSNQAWLQEWRRMNLDNDENLVSMGLLTSGDWL